MISYVQVKTLIRLQQSSEGGIEKPIINFMWPNQYLIASILQECDIVIEQFIIIIMICNTDWAHSATQVEFKKFSNSRILCST